MKPTIKTTPADVGPLPNSYISARINYVKGSHDRPIVFDVDSDWAEAATPQPTQVTIFDARRCQEIPSLDREGFALYKHEFPAIDFSDSHQIQQIWQPSIERLLKQVTGATEAITWNSNVRFSEKSAESTRTSVSAPARRVHSDFSLDFTPTDLDYLESFREVRKRIGSESPVNWRCFNIWQPISPPPHDTPIALCDARSMCLEDTIVGRVLSFDGSAFEFPLFKENPDHRWFYYSNLQPDEVLVFCGMDPHREPTRGVVAHTAFDDPSCPSDAPPRNSVEVRSLAIFGG
jgi:hypothetical protein